MKFTLSTMTWTKAKYIALSVVERMIIYTWLDCKIKWTRNLKDKTIYKVWASKNEIVLDKLDCPFTYIAQGSPDLKI